MAYLSSTGPVGHPYSPPSDIVYDALDASLAKLLDEHVRGSAEVKLASAIRTRSISESNRLPETHYRLLFGSQIQALEGLNVTGQAPLIYFEKLFQTVADKPANLTIHAGRTFGQWAKFVAKIGYASVNRRLRTFASADHVIRPAVLTVDSSNWCPRIQAGLMRRTLCGHG
ncbi:MULTISPECIES: hypothetical protein [Sphingomonas]|uniref:hypothetical protein n=1 Tax=Sphingomonas TaxID=13687 RepID=UPI001269CC01|nr:MULTISPECIES: hypothetical protein [Sphingomonas]